MVAVALKESGKDWTSLDFGDQLLTKAGQRPTEEARRGAGRAHSGRTQGVPHGKGSPRAQDARYYVPARHACAVRDRVRWRWGVLIDRARHRGCA